MNVNFEAMKEKYLEILEKHLPENYLIEEIADELLNLHSVSDQRNVRELFGEASRALCQHRTFVAMKNLGYKEGDEVYKWIEDIETVARWLKDNAL